MVVIALLVVSFAAGCGGGGGSNTPPPANTGSGSEPERTYANVELNWCHFMSPMHPFHVNIMVPFAEEVEKQTEGRVKIFVYPANELAAADKNYDAVLSGIIDIGLVLPAYTPGLFPLTSILEFPFMFTSPEQSNLTAAELFRTNPVVRDTEYKDVEVLWWGTTDLGHFLLQKPVSSLSELNGMKLRSPSTVGNDVLTALGAVPVTLPVSDTYDAIDRGIVDGTLLPISTLNSFNLAEVVSDILEMNMYATPLHMVMNKASWNKISPADQKIMRDLLDEFPKKAGDLYGHDTTTGYERAATDGIGIHKLSPEELEKFKEAVEPLVKQWLDDMEAKGLPGWEVYEQMKEIAKKHQ
jgi:TRAP-type C4-dicarboxylate transport system substrate-binding protein